MIVIYEPGMIAPDLPFALMLNDMRWPRVEETGPVAFSDSEEELLAFMAAEEVDYYRDGAWAKTFRKYGPLEWKNRPYGNPIKRRRICVQYT